MITTTLNPIIPLSICLQTSYFQTPPRRLPVRTHTTTPFLHISSSNRSIISVSPSCRFTEISSEHPRRPNPSIAQPPFPHNPSRIPARHEPPHARHGPCSEAMGRWRCEKVCAMTWLLCCCCRSRRGRRGLLEGKEGGGVVGLLGE